MLLVVLRYFAVFYTILRYSVVFFTSFYGIICTLRYLTLSTYVSQMRVFVAVLVIIITVKIHGRHDGMSMKRIRQEVYNSLKQENLITSDKDASGTDTDEISSVEQTTSRSNFAVTDIYSPSTKKKFKMFNKLGQTLAVAADRVKGSTRFNTQDSKFWGLERVDDLWMDRRLPSCSWGSDAKLLG